MLGGVHRFVERAEMANAYSPRPHNGPKRNLDGFEECERPFRSCKNMCEIYASGRRHKCVEIIAADPALNLGIARGDLACLARANRAQIAKQFLWQGLSVCIAGCVFGWALAMASTRLLAGLLYGVSPTDAPTLSSVIFLVLAVAGVASLVPAIRAARVEPMDVLREE